MTEINNLLSQINENPRLLAKIDITEETGEFDRTRMREIIQGLKNEKLIDAFIRLTVNKWNSLEARQDSRVFYGNDLFGSRLKFSGDSYSDPQRNYHEDSIDYYLDTAKSSEMHARELEAKEEEEMNDILRDLGLLDDAETNDETATLTADDHSERMREVRSAVKSFNRLFDHSHELSDEFLAVQKQVLEQLKTMGQKQQDISAELELLAAENNQLKAENNTLNSELLILRAEHAHATQTQQERDAAVRRAEELNKALEDTKEQLGRRAVTLQSLVQGIQDTPYESMKVKCLEALNHLLAGNKYWVEFRDKLNKKEMEKTAEPTIKAEHYYAEGAKHEDHSHHLSVHDQQNQSKALLE